MLSEPLLEITYPIAISELLLGKANKGYPQFWIPSDCRSENESWSSNVRTETEIAA
jgi:hypothetical protein